MNILSYYWPKAPWTLVYMLQQVEYNPGKFIAWVTTIPSLARVQQRGRLEVTARVKLMLLVAYVSWGIFMVGGVALAVIRGNGATLLLLAIAPFVCVISLFIVTFLLQRLVINPKQQTEIIAAQKKLAGMNAERIAVIGSYGKTTMKELLGVVLAEAKRVAATPGNKNVLISHARWINSGVKGDEDVLIFEYGESEPGDIERLANFSKPNYAVVTGLAPAHLDGYRTLQAVTDDFTSIKKLVKPQNIFVNGEIQDLATAFEGCSIYRREGVADIKVKDVQVGFEGTSFSAVVEGRTLRLHTGLLGKHQLGPLSAVIAVASKFGLTDEQITSGIAVTQPYEHRMQPRQLHGAWIIDDTYNGSIEGMRAGLELLADLPGKRKIYVTPGLVDQGQETQKVHRELGRLIAAARPDKVILMNNSVTQFIAQAIEEGQFEGELAIENNPLEFYTNLEHFLAGGDVVMLQNDWPDSYT